MASRIAGITVEINGNVTGLNKALETDAFTAFGLTTKDSGHFADIHVPSILLLLYFPIPADVA